MISNEDARDAAACCGGSRVRIAKRARFLTETNYYLVRVPGTWYVCTSTAELGLTALGGGRWGQRLRTLYVALLAEVPGLGLEEQLRINMALRKHQERVRTTTN